MPGLPTPPARAARALARRLDTAGRRHPFAIRTHFDHSLVLTWAMPPDALAPFLVDPLSLDLYTDADGREWGFVAAALVRLHNLRPALVRAPIGPSNVMVGYRVFCTMPTERGQTMRGLRILGSRSTSRLLTLGANLTTRYGYRVARGRLEQDGERLEVEIDDHDGALRCVADLGRHELPATTVFADARAARRFAGPLPYTFSPDPEGIVVVKADRTQWRPEPVAVEVEAAGWFDHGPLAGVERRLSNAFHVADVDYAWRRGRLVRRAGARAPWGTTVVGEG